MRRLTTVVPSLGLVLLLVAALAWSQNSEAVVNTRTSVSYTTCTYSDYVQGKDITSSYNSQSLSRQNGVSVDQRLRELKRCLTTLAKDGYTVISILETPYLYSPKTYSQDGGKTWTNSCFIGEAWGDNHCSEWHSGIVTARR